MINTEDHNTLYDIVNLIIGDPEQGLAKEVAERRPLSVVNSQISNLAIRIALLPSLTEHYMARPGEITSPLSPL
jgi:hypothetical protein